jgi:hypothetical protein
MQKTEPNLVADVELQATVMSIIVALGMLLRLKELVTNVIEDSVPV